MILFIRQRLHLPFALLGLLLGWTARADTRPAPAEHWSFQPVTRPAAPVATDQQWSRNDVDGFILARLEAQGLKPTPETDRIRWLRRVSFDLVGLPPSPERVKEFVRDRRHDAYDRVVDELLASPRYGERWAQHWLDVVRYADTHGFEVNRNGRTPGRIATTSSARSTGKRPMTSSSANRLSAMRWVKMRPPDSY
jgi:hypothetical protein